MSDKEMFELTERDKQEIRRLALKAKATYDFLERESLTGTWSGDTERFMAFTYGTTEALVERQHIPISISRALILIGNVIMNRQETGKEIDNTYSKVIQFLRSYDVMSSSYIIVCKRWAF